MCIRDRRACARAAPCVSCTQALAPPVPPVPAPSGAAGRRRPYRQKPKEMDGRGGRILTNYMYDESNKSTGTQLNAYAAQLEHYRQPSLQCRPGRRFLSLCSSSFASLYHICTICCHPSGCVCILVVFYMLPSFWGCMYFMPLGAVKGQPLLCAVQYLLILNKSMPSLLPLAGREFNLPPLVG